MTLKAIRCGKTFGVDLLAADQVAHLVHQLVHRLLAGARDRLVGRDDDAPDPRRVVQGLEDNHHLDRRAVGVGDDALLCVRDRVRVDLRHHERERPAPSGRRWCCR